jgi:hypothetical protein
MVHSTGSFSYYNKNGKYVLLDAETKITNSVRAKTQIARRVGQRPCIDRAYAMLSCITEIQLCELSDILKLKRQ